MRGAARSPRWLYALLVGAVALGSVWTLSERLSPSPLSSALAAGVPPGLGRTASPMLTSEYAQPTVGPVILVVMENKEYGQVIGSPDAPYLNQLVADNTLVDQSYAITHPSLPNYLALLGGDTFGITSDCTDCFLDQPNLVDALEAGGRSWTAYMEDLPAPCSLGSGVGGYALKHNPFFYFQDIRTDPTRCSRVVPLTQLDADLASGRLPDFAWISPNLVHDTHDASVADGDRWLAGLVPRILASGAWRDGSLLIITWDEGTSDAGCCGLAAGGHVATVLVQANGPQGAHVTEPTTHYSVLRTIEDLLQVDQVGQSGALDVHALVHAS